ncbi:putative glycosidase crf1 [Amylocarpus encephaloides]|uniref:Crh-like protein n=1 Tax=Amylocarpus encephaloides TaxID=45428 RepID=A0A9P7Y9K4_9HELO|nr:putative glycosidase crf1 [Amylocarpus encephaloides]
MRTSLSAAAVLLSATSLVSAQTFTKCDPTKKTCPADPGLGGSVTTDFLKGKSPDWTYADGTTLSYDPTNGAVFPISKSTNAPTVSFNKYIMFGKVTVEMQAAPGAGIVSSFILESDDLDEIDWEWVGSVDTEAQSNFFGKGNTTSYDRGKVHPMSGAVTGFHTYEIDWNKDTITWSIDGKTVRTLAATDPLTIGGKNYPQSPMKVKMGSWVGCADAAAAADPKTKWTCEWAGGPADFTKGPYNMHVKSVTIKDAGCGGEYTYSDMSGSWQSIKSSGKCDGTADTSVSSSIEVKPITGSQSASETKSETKSGSASASSTSASVSASASASTTGSTTVAAPSQTAAGSGSGPSGGNGTTLATATGTSGAGPVPTTTADGATSVPSSAATKPAHKYGALDMGVMVLGLGLGYLVM